MRVERGHMADLVKKLMAEETWGVAGVAGGGAEGEDEDEEEHPVLGSVSEARRPPRAARRAPRAARRAPPAAPRAPRAAACGSRARRRRGALTSDAAREPGRGADAEQGARDEYT